MMCRKESGLYFNTDFSSSLEYSSYERDATKETLSLVGLMALKGFTRAMQIYLNCVETCSAFLDSE